MSQQLTDLIDAVHAESTVVDGAVVLIQGFNARLQTAIDNGADPAVLQSLVDETKAKTQQLADAVAEVPPATP